MKKYRVHSYIVVRIPSEVIEAESAKEAARNVYKNTNYYDEVTEGKNCDFAEEFVEFYVDEIGADGHFIDGKSVHVPVDEVVNERNHKDGKDN